MKKSELRTNMVLEFSNGRSATVLIAAILPGNGEFVERDIIRYNDKAGGGFDYISLLKDNCNHPNKGDLKRVVVLAGGGREVMTPLVYWPEEVKELTVDEISAKLGYKIKVVGGSDG